VCALALFAAVTALSLHTTRLMIETTKDVTRTYQVIEALAVLDAGLARSDAADRAYAGSHSQRARHQIEDVNRSIPSMLSALHQLTLPDARARSAVARIDPFVHAKLRFSDALLASGGDDAASGTALAARGGALVARAHRTIAALEETQRTLLVDRRARSRA